MSGGSVWMSLQFRGLTPFLPRFAVGRYVEYQDFNDKEKQGVRLPWAFVPLECARTPIFTHL